MNYNKIYEDLVEKYRMNDVSGYYETHHIIPKCIGGSNEQDNLVKLPPEYHFLAHLLLCRIYKNTKFYKKLIWASMFMCVHNSDRRINNKQYGWLRRQFATNHPCKTSEVRGKIRESLRLKRINFFEENGFDYYNNKCQIYYCSECGKIMTSPYKKVCSSDCKNIRRKRTGYHDKLSKSRSEYIKNNHDKVVEAANKIWDNMSDETKARRSLKISETKKDEQNKVQLMSEEDFNEYIKEWPLYKSNGGRNGNLTLRLKWRGIDPNEYYDKRVSGPTTKQ